MARYVDILIEVDSLDVERMLSQVEARLSPAGLAAFLTRHAGPLLRERAARRFRSEGDSASGKWKPLMASTVKVRKWGIQKGLWPDIGPEHPINKRTGDMEAYLTHAAGEVVRSGEGAEMHFPEINPRTDNDMDWKLFTAQHGTRYEVKRPVLAVDMADVTFLSAAFALDLIQGGPVT